MANTNIIDMSKLVNTEYLIGSRYITSKPCYVMGYIIAPTATDSVAILNLRNGELVTSDLLISFSYIYGNGSVSPVLPIYFNKGLYVEFNTNIAGVTLQYLIEP